MAHVPANRDEEMQRARRALVALILLLYLPFLFANGYRLIREPHVDFPSFYFGAERVFKQHASPYSPDAFADAARRLDQRIYPYLYPPPSLLALYPLTHWSYEQAKRLMLVLNHLTLWLFAYILLFRLLRLDLRTPRGVAACALGAAYILAYQPLAITLSNGQINLIVVTLLLASWVGVRERHGDAWIAVPLAAAVLLKTYPLLFVPLLWFAGRRRAAGMGIVLLGAATVAAYATLPAAVWHDWLVHVLPSGGYGASPWGLFSPAVQNNQSLNGVLTRLLAPNGFTPTVWNHPEWIRPIGYAIAGAILLTSYRAAARIARAAERDTAVDLAFAVALLAMFILAPLSWLHHAVFVLPAAVVLLYRTWCDSAPPWQGALVLLAALALAWDLPLGYPSLRGHPALLAILISSKLHAAFVLWLVAVYRLSRAQQTATRAVPTPTAVPYADG